MGNYAPFNRRLKMAMSMGTVQIVITGTLANDEVTITDITFDGQSLTKGNQSNKRKKTYIGEVVAGKGGGGGNCIVDSSGFEWCP
jgi:hypothetical protein